MEKNHKINFIKVPLWKIGTGQLRTGTSFSQKDFKPQGIPLIKIGNFLNQKIDVRNCSYVEDKGNNLTKKNDVLIAMRGGTTGKLALVDKNSVGLYYVGSVGNFGHLNTDLIWPPYLKLIQEELYRHFVEGTSGSATPMVSIKMLKEIEIVIPATLNEQEKFFQLFEQRRFIANSLKSTINNQEILLKKLRQAILQEAIEGKLTAKWRKENSPPVEGWQTKSDGVVHWEPASELLKRIKAEKEQLIIDKKIRVQKPLPPIKDEEKPFELPEGWEWCRVGELGEIIGGGTPSKSNPYFWDGQIPWICPKDMKKKYLKNSIYQITADALSNSSAKLLPRLSILFVVRGMILAHTFPVAITIANVTINQDMKALIPHISNMEEFIYLLFSGSSKSILKRVRTSTHGTCRLENVIYSNWVIALPPLNEQKTIITKVEKLLSVCNQLEQRINDGQVYTEQLMQAVLREAFDESRMQGFK